MLAGRTKPMRILFIAEVSRPTEHSYHTLDSGSII
jgi:hypothetical protein